MWYHRLPELISEPGILFFWILCSHQLHIPEDYNSVRSKGSNNSLKCFQFSSLQTCHQSLETDKTVQCGAFALEVTSASHITVCAPLSPRADWSVLVAMTTENLWGTNAQRSPSHTWARGVCYKILLFPEKQATIGWCLDKVSIKD